MRASSAGGIHGVVLAGGLSRRMESDKAEVILRGRSLLARVCDRLAPQCDGLAVSRHAVSGRPADLEYPIIEDGITNRAGPIAGVLAALDWSAARHPSCTHVVTVAVDTPFLPSDFVSRLVATRHSSGEPIACAASGGRIHPVAALWPVALRDVLRDWLVTEGVRRALAILERFGFSGADWPTTPFDPFLNVNTPDDLRRAEALATAFDDADAPQ